MQVLSRKPHEKDIKPGTGAYSMDNPAYRRAFQETMERVSRMDPRDLAPERRLTIKAMRFQGNTPELVAKSAAIRTAMSREINR